MGKTQDEIRRNARTRCAKCDDVIGIYEPLVLAGRDGDRKTSQAAEPQLFPTPNACFHGACYEPPAS